MKAFGTSILALLVLLVSAWSGLVASASAADAALVAATGDLTVSTVNSAGKPVAGALVNVFPSGSSTPAATGTTNASGKVTFAGLAAGSYSIFASKLTGFGSAIYGSGSATVGSKPVGVTIVLGSSAP